MRSRHMLLVWLLMIVPAIAYAQPDCAAPALSGEQVKALVAKARETRRDLPPPFAESTWTVKRQRCHYVYMERMVPETPEGVQIFRLNQLGVIVDVQPGEMTCSEKALTEGDLAAIVKKERTSHRDLPAPYPNLRVRVERSRCLYLYFEYAVPERRGEYRVFTIDPLGELMDVYSSQPY